MLFVLTDYIQHAMQAKRISRLGAHSFCGEIPGFSGLVVFADSVAECEQSLRRALEGLILISLKLDLNLPEIHGINLNEGSLYASPVNA